NAAVAGAGNRAAGTGNGGGFAQASLASEGGVFFRSTILAGNSASTAGPDILRASPASLGNNLVGDASGAPNFSTSDLGDQIGGRFGPVIDAKLGPLAYNGGP